MQDVDNSSIERVNAVRRLRAAAAQTGKNRPKAHIIGVCGTGMTAVLQLLKHYGIQTSGSDKAFYPPMGDVVRRTADQVFESYSADNIAADLDLVVIGNSVSRDNPEVQAVFDRGLPYASMPEVFSALLIGERSDCGISIVVAGTHGKTTTSCATAFLLDAAGRKPGYFIGGVPIDLPSGMRPVPQDLAPTDRCVVLEGDEYDSAFFAKWPKFHSYRPDIAIVTSLEFDHGDIYKSIEEIEEEFTKLARRVPAGGTVLVCDQWPRLVKLANTWRSDPEVRASIAMYGNEVGSAYHIKLRAALSDRSVQIADHPENPDPERTSPGQQLVLELAGSECRAVIGLTGEHNALNLCAAAAAASVVGAGAEQIAEALGRFHGVLRRQTIRYDRKDLTVIEDFAHHPTAIEMTLRALRESYPMRRLIAVYEPRSATGRRSYFQDDYPSAFAPADLVVIQEVLDAGRYSGTGDAIVALDVEKIVQAVSAEGKDARSFDSSAAIEQFLVEQVNQGDLVVIMTNGDFGGMIPKLVAGLDKKFAPPDAK